ncbi:MAG: ATP synthase subunit I [Eubacteriales bacterium]|jgi:hypothetical protein
MKMSNLAKRTTIAILVIVSICVIVSVIYYRSLGFLPFLFGALLGSAVSIAKIFLLERTIDKALKMEKKSAGQYVSIQYILRLLLTGVVLVLGAVVPQINLWGVVSGIFAFHIALYFIKFTTKS